MEHAEIITREEPMLYSMSRLLHTAEAGDRFWRLQTLEISCSDCAGVESGVRLGRGRVTAVRLDTLTMLGTMLVTMPLRSLISRYWLPFSHKCVTFIIAKCRRYVLA